MLNRICNEEQTGYLLTQLRQHHEYTYHHSLRVAHHSFEIATKMGFSNEAREILFRSSLLHDIGKLNIKKNILEKKTKLSQSEFDLIKLHPQYGIEVIEKKGYRMRIDRDVILQHHENLDGTGYPRGVSESKLSLNVRIVRIADSYDAMTSSRSYNTVKNIEEARKELHRYKQRSFDTDVLRVFDRYLEENFAKKLEA